MEQWFDFGIVIGVQLILFLFHAQYEKRLREAPAILLKSVLIAIPFGITFDLVVGKFFGFYSYELGFTPLFLFVNALCSYGFMQANVLLMDQAHLLHFYLWTVFVGFIYEVVNYIFPVWTWEFGTSAFTEYVIVMCACYFGISLLMALTWHSLLRHRFALIEQVQQKIIPR